MSSSCSFESVLTVCGTSDTANAFLRDTATSEGLELEDLATMTKKEADDFVAAVRKPGGQVCNPMRRALATALMKWEANKVAAGTPEKQRVRLAYPGN